MPKGERKKYTKEFELSAVICAHTAPSAISHPWLPGCHLYFNFLSKLLYQFPEGPWESPGTTFRFYSQID